ncbi:MAG: T9SS type A sorting domain-containing protein [Flavobacteriaceae bacterium]|nr:T9SS type A sorting domain-containing protein [Flavobacteriaceae bacterium]
MAKKLLFTFLLLTLSTAIFAQDVDSKDKDILEESLSGISDVVASPNPFSVTTRIRFNADDIFEIDFYVKDLLGNVIHTEKVKTKKGPNSIPFFREELESGIYIYSLKTKSKVISKRIVIK